MVERAGERLSDPAARRARRASSSCAPADAAGALPGELVVAERDRRRARSAPIAPACSSGSAGRASRAAISLLAAHSLELRIAFPPEVEALRRGRCGAVSRRRAGRTCARCRWSRSTARTRATSTTRSRAAPDDDPANPGGWQVVVAIADVAHYVRPGERARSRGQAARQLGLFPGPRPADAAGGAVQRSVLAAAGRGPRLRRGAHVARSRRARSSATASLRGLMRSRARLTYAQVQAAADGAPRCGRGAPARAGDPAAVRRLRGPARGAAAAAAPSTSICPRPRSGSTTAGRPVAIERAAAPGLRIA